MKISKPLYFLSAVFTLLISMQSHAESVRHVYVQDDCALLGGPNYIFMYYDANSFTGSSSIVAPICDEAEEEQYFYYDIEPDDLLKDFSDFSNGHDYDDFSIWFSFHFENDCWEFP